MREILRTKWILLRKRKWWRRVIRRVRLRKLPQSRMVKEPAKMVDLDLGRRVARRIVPRPLTRKARGRKLVLQGRKLALPRNNIFMIYDGKIRIKGSSRCF